MEGTGGDENKMVNERRRGVERRKGKMEDKFRHSVSIGFFLDLRKGDRRKNIGEDIISYN